MSWNHPTTEDLPPTPIDKSGWPSGLWHEEPDYLLFTACGFPCEVARNPRYGFLCGYVRCRFSIPTRALTEEVTYGLGGSYGFDCNHAWEYAPGSDNAIRDPEHYCGFEAVHERTKKFAKEIRRLSVWWRRALRHVGRTLQRWGGDVQRKQRGPLCNNEDT